VVTDQAHTTDVPTLDPRDWNLRHASPDAGAVDAPPGRDAAVAVAIDLLDEDHSLELALRRLGRDAALRRTLGANAHTRWETRHTVAHMLEDYLAAIEAALATPHVPPRRALLPPHLLEEGRTTLWRLTREMGVADPLDA
jgi:hypothetical protein